MSNKLNWFDAEFNQAVTGKTITVFKPDFDKIEIWLNGSGKLIIPAQPVERAPYLESYEPEQVNELSSKISKAVRSKVDNLEGERRRWLHTRVGWCKINSDAMREGDTCTSFKAVGVLNIPICLHCQNFNLKEN